jgi:hypothetical protein
MNTKLLPAWLVLLLGTCSGLAGPPLAGAPRSATATRQAPAWSPGDEDFFLHGSMSTEVAPEAVLRAFTRVYPDLFPSFPIWQDYQPLASTAPHAMSGTFSRVAAGHPFECWE